VVTIGGGAVIDLGEVRYRKAVPAGARLDVLASGNPQARIALLVRESKFGLGANELVARTGLLASEIATASTGTVTIAQAQPWYIDRSWFQAARDRLVKAVRKFHTDQPLLPGIAKQDLRNRELPDSPPFLIDALLSDTKDLVVEGETVRSRGHQVVLKEEEEQARAAIESAFERAGLTAPAMDDVLAQSAVEPARARRLLAILLREKRLVKITNDLVFHQTALDKLRTMLAARRTERFGVGAFKEWTGISRKYAIPLLEFLDRERVTRREGDERIVL